MGNSGSAGAMRIIIEREAVFLLQKMTRGDDNDNNNDDDRQLRPNLAQTGKMKRVDRVNIGRVKIGMTRHDPWRDLEGG